MAVELTERVRVDRDFDLALKNALELEQMPLGTQVRGSQEAFERLLEKAEDMVAGKLNCLRDDEIFAEELLSWVDYWAFDGEEGQAVGDGKVIGLDEMLPDVAYAVAEARVARGTEVELVGSRRTGREL